MGQPKPKRQHYVPQWHLRRFRDPSAKARQDYVAAYDKVNKRLHPRMAIKNVAVEADLYTMTSVDAAEAYKVEELLARRDEFDAKLTSQILDQGTISASDAPAIRQLLAFQHFRTRSLREWLRTAYREEQRQLAVELMANGPPTNWSLEDQMDYRRSVEEPKVGEWESPRGEDDLLALQFGVNPTFLSELDLFRGFVLVVLLDEVFATSDNPIVAQRTGFPQWGTIMEIGLANTGVLWFPLKPRRALVVSRSSQPSPTQIGLPAPQVRAINNALMRASDRWTIWQPGSAADQFLDLPRG